MKQRTIKKLLLCVVKSLIRDVGYNIFFLQEVQKATLVYYVLYYLEDNIGFCFQT